MKEAFHIIDDDDSGEIDVDEMTAIMKNISSDISEAQLDEIMSIAD